MAPDDDSEIPETGAVFTFGKSKFAENVPNKFWVRNDKVFLTACGDEHTALVAESGRLFTFGSNDWGQLGLGHTKVTTKPSCVKSLKHEKVKLVGCGRTHTIVATESGYLYAFGANGENQLGVDDTPGSNNPKCIDTLEPTEYTMLAAGMDHSMALTADGRVYVWGSGSEGQLGLGAETECPKPKLLPFDKHVTCIDCGYYHSAIVTDDGELYTFGETDGGKLGLGDDPDEYDTPQPVTSIRERVKWVSCGGSHTVAVTENGKVYTFGNGANGQLGLGTMNLEVALPNKITSLESRVTFSSCGENHTALLTEKGQLYTFGDGRHGKLGLGMDSFANQFIPCRVKRFEKMFVEKVSCGGCHMLALSHPRLQNGDVYSDDDDEDTGLTKSPRIDTLKADSLDLNGSISAREKRRQISPMPSFNRTLPTLSSMKSLPPLNSTLPAVGSDQNGNHPLTKSLLPGIDLIKQKSLKRQSNTEGLESDESDEGRHDTIQKITTADIHSAPLSQPKPAPRKKMQDIVNDEVKSLGSENEDDHLSDKDMADGPKISPRNLKKEEENSVFGEDRDKKEDKKDEDAEEVSDIEEDTKSKDKKKNKKGKDKKKEKKKSSGGIFGRKKVESEDEEDEDGEEEEVDEDSKKKKKGKTKEKKDKKDKKKDKDEQSDEDKEEKDDDEDDVKGKKKKDKKKDKGKDKKKKKDEEEEDEEVSFIVEEVISNSHEEEYRLSMENNDKDSKKKDKDKKDKKSKETDKKDNDKKKDKDKEKEEEENEKEDEDNKDNNENEKDKNDDEKDKKEDEEKKPPTKKSRTCTIL